MEALLYSILLVYFLLGGLIMAKVNQGKDPDFRSQNWLKYVVYLILTNLLFIVIMFWPSRFYLIGYAILALGSFEITRLTYESRDYRTGATTLLIFGILAWFFSHFSRLPGKYLFFTLFMTTVFDAFSQLGGQLFGRRKLVPAISPNKTVEGLISGLLAALLTAGMIHGLLARSVAQSMLLGLGITAFAFIGDLSASYCKRKFNTKDFSKLIPGHGGVLDRFDSLIVAGTFVWVLEKTIGL